MTTKKKKTPRDVNANVHRIFDEMIERSEKPPNRGTLTPAAKDGTSKAPITSGETKRR